mgnify:CR=1 FL=1
MDSASTNLSLCCCEFRCRHFWNFESNLFFEFPPPSPRPNQAHPLACPMLFIYMCFKNICIVKTHGLYKPKPTFLLMPFGAPSVKIQLLCVWPPLYTVVLYTVVLFESEVFVDLKVKCKVVYSIVCTFGKHKKQFSEYS